MRTALSVLAILLHRLARHEPAATIAGSNTMTAVAIPGFGTTITHLREVLGDQTYESLARKGETLPVPAVRVNQRTFWSIREAGDAPVGGGGLYARVWSHDQRADLDRQLARLRRWAAQADVPVVRVEAEVGSGMTGSLPQDAPVAC